MIHTLQSIVKSKRMPVSEVYVIEIGFEMNFFSIIDDPKLTFLSLILFITRVNFQIQYKQTSF